MQEEDGRKPRADVKLNLVEVKTSRQLGAGVEVVVVVVVIKGGWYDVSSGLEVVWGGGVG